MPMVRSREIDFYAGEITPEIVCLTTKSWVFLFIMTCFPSTQACDLHHISIDSTSLAWPYPIFAQGRYRLQHRLYIRYPGYETEYSRGGRTSLRALFKCTVFSIHFNTF